MIFFSRTVKGQAREDNRDALGALFDGVRGVFVIADGTSRPGSGDLARTLTNHLINDYQNRLAQGFSDSSRESVALLLRGLMQDAHASLYSNGFEGSASYLVAVVVAGFLAVAYEGDCCAGVVMSGGTVSWLTAPHCLANWRRDRSHRQLATDSGRHHISRCFKARKQPDPEIVTRAMGKGEKLVLATDGFWADLSDMVQARLLEADWTAAPEVDDDASWIVVQMPA
ncbi:MULTISPECIES: protein phosphatase 2C domain-containing protein [Pseudomonas]|uniref:Protein phosphatase 2C domain-containing protein n=1 Tax=Pseudomonas qingdaonensis TaxID=2056231 RepID=A0ABX8DSA0_9PSED|nr:MULTISPECIES: protein phosphatase 2C domain-containing protein [Pseudomonas]MCO7503870.1 protein phosphatase 2C domain-containing protein [Pseudomonas sp. VE 267-6A]MCO7530291.1 protein phosphatase 2C domain-containing protein [Pseudomonas sp. 2]QVL19181.1 protein phosphatase 2C domain-containing protein [Pseudomonas qingdaonensis]